MTGHDDNEYRRQRLAKLEQLAEMGIRPAARSLDRTGDLAQVRSGYAEGRQVAVAGRLTTLRDMGKSLFADLRDGSGRLQIYVQRDQLGPEGYRAFKLLDLGDQIGVTGSLFTTRTGEQTVKVAGWSLLAKALRPLPEKWHGLKDVETRFRQRYLDLIANPEVRELFNRRSRMLSVIRAYLEARGFQEVETPMMQPHAGGAAAKPFVTRFSALGSDMYLRIAPELYLKRLLVGGFEKIFELNRNFRNEGLSRTHNPEFTMLEVYQAYTDVRGMQELIQDLIPCAAREVFGTLRVGSDACPVDLTPPWREVRYRDLLREKMGADWYDTPVAEARRRAEALDLTVDPSWDHVLIGHEVYEKTIERTLVQPTFVTRLPAALIPLARACDDDPASADVFELVIGGTEIAPGYTEMNDPLEQRRRLAIQVGHDPEKADEDFLTALEHGMPPAGGMGVGIDRLLMVLSGAESIRDVILFPQLREKA